MNPSTSSCCCNSQSPSGAPCFSSMTYTPPFPTMPPWLRFSPSDEHLVGHFLLGKILGRLCSSDYVQEPWEIWERYRGFSSNLTVSAHEEEDLYLFTELKKVSVKGCRIDRRVGKGDGIWHGSNAGVQVVVKTDEFLLGEGFVGLEGRKKQFSYRGSSFSNGFRWVMHEFSLSWSREAAHHSMVVLCRIRRNKNKVFSSYAAAAAYTESSSLPSRKRKAEDDERAFAMIDLESSQATTLTDPIPKRVRKENEEIQEAAQAGAIVVLDTPIIGTATMDPSLEVECSNSGSKIDGLEIVDPTAQQQVQPLIVDGDFGDDEEDKCWRNIQGLDMDSEAFDFNWDDYEIDNIDSIDKRMDEFPLWHEMTVNPSSAVGFQC